jgi:orotidine-5'-phosphate decarboxylase
MLRNQLVQQIKEKKSYLCVGLDTDIHKIPKHLLSYTDPVFEFNRQVIDATAAYCVSYKINTAFYEAQGVKGWESMEKTVRYIGNDHFKIADAKRGDIGNTATQYAKAFFETLPFDAVTVAPYMGEDSIRPFLDYPGKVTIVLGLTSNAGAKDFELQQLNNNGKFLYEEVLQKVSSWGTPDNLMFVAGATRPEQFEQIRKYTAGHFLLVPGVGLQGGNLAEVSKFGMTAECGLLVNVSRAIIYASEKEDFAAESAAIAQQYQNEMEGYLIQFAHDL